MRDDLTAVYESQSLMEAQLLSDRLKAAGIECFIDGSHSPLDGLVAADQVQIVRVLPTDAEKAKEIVAQFVVEQEET